MLAGRTVEAGRAGTSEAGDIVATQAAVPAGLPGAVVDVGFAVGAVEARGAHAATTFRVVRARAPVFAGIFSAFVGEKPSSDIERRSARWLAFAAHEEREVIVVVVVVATPRAVGGADLELDAVVLVVAAHPVCNERRQIDALLRRPALEPRRRDERRRERLLEAGITHVAFGPGRGDAVELEPAVAGRHLWARGYFCATSGNVTDDVIARYIEQQDAEPPDDVDFKVTE